MSFDLSMETWWLIWFLIVLIGFIVLERWAFRTDRPTLSRVVVHITTVWPLFPFLLGLVVGGLAVHFFWHWCPELGIGNG